MDPDTETPAQGSRAPRALAALTVVALVVAVLVLLIDQQIKRDIISQAMAARRLLDEAKALTEGAAGERLPGPATDPVPDSGRGDAPDPVPGSTGMAAETGSDGSGVAGSAGNGTAAPRRRARRNDG